MCSETFLRLPEEKKNRFLDAAWEEFTNVPYADASINKIVSRARVPRGSFYQYFTDKQENQGVRPIRVDCEINIYAKFLKKY